MSLARELKMTRWQLLNSMDSYELSMWEAFLAETNRPPEPQPQEFKKEDSRVLAEKLKTAFAVKAGRKKRKS